MTKQIGGIWIIAEEQPQQCDLCGQIAELRPNGPRGKCICWACATKSKLRCAARMYMRFGVQSRREAIRSAADQIRRWPPFGLPPLDDLFKEGE
jgi:hypothetical protein